MSHPPRVKAENTSRFPSRESEMQGLSGTIPETPDRRFESRTTSPVARSWRKMFGIPKRSETKTTEVPPGPHCGEMFAPCWFGSTVTFPVPTSRIAMQSFPKMSFFKSVAGPSSVEKRIRPPSGDHAGSRTAYMPPKTSRRPLPSTLQR